MSEAEEKAAGVSDPLEANIESGDSPPQVGAREPSAAVPCTAGAATAEADEGAPKDGRNADATAAPVPEDVVNNNGAENEVEGLRASLQRTRLELEERERRLKNQEGQIGALTRQVASLKEVVGITKDMLGIRNAEVQRLQEDVARVEARIAEERGRQGDMVGRMEAAVRLNADLKTEYQTQLRLFQDLRGKYEEKVSLLSEENRALETAVRAQPAQ